MASVWITTRTTKSGARRFRVEYRLGGREAPTRCGGSFKTKTEALERRKWITGELAARRVPDLAPLTARTVAAMPTLREAYERWQAGRVDVAGATAIYQRSAIRRARPLLDRHVDEITASDVAALVADLVAVGRSRETIRKTVAVVGMVLDHARRPAESGTRPHAGSPPP
jgi:hypothetical protein